MFSFQSQIKAIPKNAQTTTQLQISKFSKPGFKSIRTVNFQMFKLDLEKAEGSEIKWPTSIGSLRKQEFQKTSTSSLLTIPKSLTVWIAITMENS